MKKLIHSFKYGQKTFLRKTFTNFVCSFVSAYHIDMTAYDMAMSVPLHPTRFRERGYNQSELIAQSISQIYHIKFSQRNLTRVKNTRNQALLSQKERWTNIHGAFKIENSSEVRQKSVLLFDDLLTTGATTSEAAFVIKQAGAKKVNVLTLSIAR
ncbi:MAG: hypothetical protein ABIJ41_04325 [Candidatus Omnitrophota bacterium]